MNDREQPALLKEAPPQPLLPGPDRDAPESPPGGPAGRRRPGRRLLGLGVLLLFVAALGLGAWRHYQGGREVALTAAQHRNFVPVVRVAAVRASDAMSTVSLPATTTAFEAANILARTSGYIEKRHVDIGDRVKAGALLAQITAPELDHPATLEELLVYVALERPGVTAGERMEDLLGQLSVARYHRRRVPLHFRPRV